MTKTEYRQYIASAEWQERRKNFLNDQGYKCARCEMPRWLARIAYDQDLHVHHKSYAHLGAESWSDLEALCRRCHDIETFGRSDLRKPSEVVCNQCGERHWNPREEMCPICLFVLGLGTDPRSLYDYAVEIDPTRFNNPFWTTLIYYAYKAVVNSGRSVDLILEELVRLEEQEYSIRNPHPSTVFDKEIPF